MIEVNKKVPDLEMQVYEGDEIKKVRISDFKGKWLALVFYPSDFTFVCPTELGELADRHKEFREAGAEIMSVSTDTVYTHKAWHESSQTISKVKYPMAADPNGRVSMEFGVYIEEEGVALRGSFIIDPDGILKAYEVHDNDIGRSAKELLRKIQAAKFVREAGGEVCPASWEPGKETLRKGLDLVGKI